MGILPDLRNYILTFLVKSQGCMLALSVSLALLANDLFRGPLSHSHLLLIFLASMLLHICNLIVVSI